MLICIMPVPVLWKRGTWLAGPWRWCSSGDSGPGGRGAVARVAELLDAVVAAGGRVA
jgi:hypothetical protein